MREFHYLYNAWTKAAQIKAGHTNARTRIYLVVGAVLLISCRQLCGRVSYLLIGYHTINRPRLIRCRLLRFVFFLFFDMNRHTGRIKTAPIDLRRENYKLV